MIVREFVFGMPAGAVAQLPNVREETWLAIFVSEGPIPPPPPVEFGFPWWLVGIVAAAAAAIGTQRILKIRKRS